ncbi:glycoside hydrolase family 18 protein [Yersinia enterocolitica]|nr:hypothetical protein [Yersinia enterocolitica]
MKKTALALVLSSVFAFSAQAAENRSISYLTSWGLADTDVPSLKASNVSTYLLSFGTWDNNGKVTSSDGIADAPDYDPWWMPSSYIAWTQMKLEQQDKKIMLAFGGQTYESMWSHIGTEAQREIVATNLVKLLDTPLPVYKKNLDPTSMEGPCLHTTWNGSSCDFSVYQTAGHVYLDGIDFDFEKAARLTEKENADLLALVSRVREMLNENGKSDKLLSLTTYHVGADPENCADNQVFDNCSYIETKRSGHHGEVTKLLADSKDIFDFFNVMTYDAGKSFKYQVAMNNYAKAIGDASKVVVGTSINHQWDEVSNFVETKENNLDRARWQAEKGYGGFFTWALGASTINMSVADQVSYLNDMIDEAKNATVEVPEVPEVPVEQGKPTVHIDNSYAKGYGLEMKLSEDEFKAQKRYIVKVNGSYVFETYEGKSYYSSNSVKNGVVTVAFNKALNEGDVVSLYLVEGKPGQSYSNSTLKSETTIQAKQYVSNPADNAVKSITNSGNTIKVTLDDNLFKEQNRYIVKVNGKYAMETHMGKAYYSSISKSADTVTIQRTWAVAKGDVITVVRAAGTPGLASDTHTEISKYTVK